MPVMKKLLLILSLALFSISNNAQISWQGGSIPEEINSATILFDKTGTGLESYSGMIYAHTGVTIGDNTVISSATAIAGSTHIGKGCLIGGLVGIVEHLEITDNVMITGRTMVTRSITQAGSYSSSTPMDTTANWRKNSARFRRLDELAKRVAKLEKTNKSSGE